MKWMIANFSSERNQESKMLKTILIVAIVSILAALFSCDALLNSKPILTGIQLNLTSMNLIQGETAQLVVSNIPSTATTPSLKWVSGDASVVTADQNGSIVAGTAGITTITVSTLDNNKQDVCDVAVWGKDGAGSLQFLTNNTKYYTWGFWVVPPGQSNLDLATYAATIVLQKNSGSSSRGFGFLFCYQDDNNFYQLMIATNGKIQVSKKVNGIESTVLGWTSNSHLSTGTAANTISVSRNSTNILITVNGTQISVPDSSFVSGKVAFFSAVGNASDETFPAIAEDIRIKMTAPILFP